MLNKPFPETSKRVVRIVAVRHGFGKHNEGMGIGSMANRDADLVPSIGVPQVRNGPYLYQLNYSFRECVPNVYVVLALGLCKWSEVGAGWLVHTANIRFSSGSDITIPANAGNGFKPYGD